MIEIKGLSKTFNKGSENEIKLFENFSITFEEGKCTALLGSNGCGKSTLLNIISGNIAPDSGLIVVDGEDVTKDNEEKRAMYIGRVHQNPSLGVSASLNILENMSLADKKGEKFGIKRLIRPKNRVRYESILKELDLGLENKMDVMVKFLSGGQRQSLSLCMATMKNPKLLLLDEHTAALDPKTSRVIMEKTRELLERKAITTIMISHNMKDAITYSDRVVMLDQGEIILDRPSSQITEEELLSIYTAKLLEFQRKAV
ncbi:ATP-binding cassette domain-containing protein [Clostridiales bacterium COT073_COT-073]|nr:ATP-binding cassette domain-containing protein [Clostridiales bacterium COT073_COT-073]